MNDWESATWEGNRRAQLRRSLQLTVRERLQALEGLAETSRRLADLSDHAPYREKPNPEEWPGR